MRFWRKWIKYSAEMSYWMWRRLREGRLDHGHYEAIYTRHFGLEPSFCENKRILDIGCGPRGSLEWADMTRERVGLDPLVPGYRKLGIDRHQMTYSAAPSEDIPFADGYFDVVTSINSLDHVNDLDRTIAEIKRVLAPGGTFLLAVDVHPEPTLCEPAVFDWDIVARFQPELVVQEKRELEKAFGGMGKTLTQAPVFDHDDPRDRHGILQARFEKPKTPATAP